MGKQKQEGAVLLICLVMLLVLTMIGISSMSNSTLQERMAGGARDYNQAFQAAEAALRVGEAHVRQQVEASADPTLLFQTASACPAVTATQWSPPADLIGTPKQPICEVSNFYGGAAGSTSFVCETDGSIAENRAFDCLSRTYLFNVEATGYGSGDIQVRLQSTIAIAISGQN
ncbi:pilus assembly PilX family protein [Pseudomonas zhanjiangensis]|uniref:PilX N-terminal domain-containing pilus assembly protein n=1 Tax=Pseudomonas zhanjiangensis TaxID=3239015 RepID=A0ABV3YR58_9PSED